MNSQHNIDETTQYLNQTLTGYEVIPANFGWHIHQGDTYHGLLQYQGTKGWDGSAFSCLPCELQEQLKRFGQSVPSLLQVAA
ncbi:MAG TPA: hypothetical protein V6D35_00660 [Candidatus Sericytochromatia bacterium]